MRSPFTLLTLLILALLAINATAWTPISKDDEAICRKKNGDAAQAIQSYCNKAPLVRTCLSNLLAIARASVHACQVTSLTLNCLTDGPRPRRPHPAVL